MRERDKDLKRGIESEPESKEFHLGDILSITTGRLLSPKKISGVYEILNFMTDDDLFTHQLPRASRECKPHLINQMPWLSGIDADGVNENNWEKWLASQVKEHGRMHNVRKIPAGSHKFTNPLLELIEMMDKR